MALPTGITYPLPSPDELPAPRVPWVADATRSALLVHDMQVHFLRAFQAGVPPLVDAIRHIADLLQAARSVGIPVYYTAQPTDQTPAQRGLLTDFWGTGLVGDDEGARIVDALAPTEGDVVLTKWRYDAFARSGLLEQMHRNGRDQLVVTGVYGHIGCLVTSIRAFMQDVQPFIVADAIADFDAELHRMTLDYVAGRCGVVTTAAAVGAAWHTDLPRLRGELADLLGLPADEITPDADLTLLGLDSVRALTLVDRWSAAGVHVDLLDFYADPTPSGFLRLVSGDASRAAR